MTSGPISFWDATPPSGVSFTEHRLDFDFNLRRWHPPCRDDTILCLVLSPVVAALLETMICFVPIPPSAVDRLAELVESPSSFPNAGLEQEAIGRWRGLPVFVDVTAEHGSGWFASEPAGQPVSTFRIENL